MARINPNTPKRLRKSKGWSQEQLADSTRLGGLPRIDTQTISRLERGKAGHTRGRTIDQLARALSVDRNVLVQEAPESQPARMRNARTQLKISIGTEQRNALHLVALRYNVVHQQIIELAPLLFCWAAEASLRQRRNRIDRFEVAEKSARDALRGSQYLPIPASSDAEEIIASERASIDANDILGLYLELPAADYNADNPFETFLRELVADFRDIITFDFMPFMDSPEYKVCPEEASQLVGGDLDLTEDILEGRVPLHELPSEIDEREPGMTEQRTEWARAQAAEFRAEIMQAIDRHRATREA